MNKWIFVMVFIYLPYVSIVKIADSESSIDNDPVPTPGIVAEVLSIAVDGSHPLRFLDLESLRALADGGALINEKGRSELLVRVTATGAVVGTVYDAGRSELRGVYELGDDLIVVLESPYIKRLNFNPPLYPEIDTYNYIAGISEVIPYLGESFIHTDFGTQSVKLYNMSSQTSQVLTTDVNYPTGIAWYYNETDGTSRFYVGQFNGGNWKIFDESWTVVSTVAHYYQVTSIIISPVKTLWVADVGKGIDEFDLYGNFKRNVLSNFPEVWSMSYHPAHPNYVWVSFFDNAIGGNNVKRFKIY